MAVVGLGLMGVTHLKAYQQLPGVRIAAVVGNTSLPVNGVLVGSSGNVGGADSIQLGPDVKVLRRFEDLLAEPTIQAVSICTPTPLHAEQSIAALRAGKHVLCEKPMGRTPAVAREIARAASEAQSFFMPAMCMRFWPGWSQLKQIVAQETYGKVLGARFRRVSGPPTWGTKTYFNGAESGGALLDLHIHDADFVQFLFGKPKRVFSTGRSRFSGAIDHVVTQYEVAGGTTVHAEGSWIQTRGFAMQYTLNFERATLDFDKARGEEALRIDDEGGTRFEKSEEKDGYAGQARYFVECIKAGRAPEVVNAMDGVGAVEICAAEELSIQTRQPVEL